MKWKNFLYYFCCIIFLFSFLDYHPTAMDYLENDGKNNKKDRNLILPHREEALIDPYDQSPKPSPRNLENDEEDEDNPQADSMLGKLNNIAQATRAHFPWTWKESLAGVAAGIPAAFAGLPFTALCTLGVVYYGVIPIPPEGTLEYYATMTAFGAPPCYAVASAVYEGGPAIVETLGNGLRAVGRGAGYAYNAVMGAWSGSGEDDNDVNPVQQVESDNKEPCYTLTWTDFKENWLSLSLKPKIYSWITGGSMTLFLCGFYFDFMVKLETKHYENDPESGKIWGYTFGALSVPFTWYIFAYSTRNPYIHPFRQLSKDDRIYVNKISQIQDILRASRGCFLRQPLPELPKELDENWDTIVDPSNNTLEQEMDKIIGNNLPSYEESWRHKATVYSTWASLGFSVPNTFPTMPLIAYFLWGRLFTTCGASGNGLYWGPIVGTALSFPLLALISARLLPLSQKEIYRWLDWGLKPEGSPGYWGERLAPLLARWCSLTTMGLPTAFYLKREVLNLPYLKDYHPIQYCLIAPFVAFTIMPAASLFYEAQFHKIANWCAKGAPFYGYRLFCCYDNNEDRIFKPLSFSFLSRFTDQETALRLMNRLEVAKGALETNDNVKDLKIWGNKRLAWKGGESSSLIDKQDTDI